MHESDASPATDDPPANDTTAIVRPPWRARLVRVFFVVVLAAQAILLVRADADRHHRFGFQPFSESSTWESEISRVTADGRRVPVTDPWPGGYRWNDLVGWSVLAVPHHRRHAYSSLDASIDHLRRALRWVAEHTPDDGETVYLEAVVRGWRNTRGPVTIVLRSAVREEAP